VFVLQHTTHMFGKGLSSEAPLCTVQMLLWPFNSLSGQRVLQIVRLTLLFNLRRIFLHKYFCNGLLRDVAKGPVILVYGSQFDLNKQRIDLTLRRLC